MTTVPKGKTVYIGARRFIAGDVIPPHFAIHLPDEKPVDDYEEKPKRQYARRNYRDDD